MLTDTQCKKALPGDRDRKIADGLGLYLFVTSTGFKSWRWKYRHGGKEKRLVLGTYPEMSLRQARETRDDARRVLREGIDPAVERRQRRSMSIAETPTFESVTREWHEAQTSRWTKKHGEQVLSSLEDHIFPELGHLPLASITSRMVLDAIRAIEARPAIDTAKRVRSRVSKVFVYAIASDLASSNPAASIEGALKPLRKGRRPALVSVTEAQSLIRASESSPSQPVTKLASRFLALTAVRPGLLGALPWGELVDLDGPNPLWHIPAARIKLDLERKQQGDRYDFLVPLSRQAVEVLKVARRITGAGPIVFPSTRHAHEPMSENTLSYFYNRLPQFAGRHVPHGWRSTFSTIMNERAAALDRPGDRAIIDLMLAHLPSDVEGIYNRAAYLPRRRILAQEWADLLMDGLPAAESLLEGKRH